MITLIIVLIIIAVVTVFSVQNAIPVVISFLFWKFEASLAIVLFLCVLAGVPGLHVFSKFTIARVGTVLLSTILKEKGFEVKTFIEDISEPDWAFIENSDLVCISTLTSTAIRAYEIGERLKSSQRYLKFSVQADRLLVYS
jgi:uncharacterized integral membrane protein